MSSPVGSFPLEPIQPTDGHDGRPSATGAAPPKQHDPPQRAHCLPQGTSKSITVEKLKTTMNSLRTAGHDGPNDSDDDHGMSACGCPQYLDGFPPAPCR